MSMSIQQEQGGLTAQQKQKFHDDGFLHIRNLLPNEALQPLIDELSKKVDEGTQAAVKASVLAPSDTYDDEPFETRLGMVSSACSDPNWIWSNFFRDARRACLRLEQHQNCLML